MMRKILFLVLLPLILSSCAGYSTFQAYQGDTRSDMQVATLSGAQYLRQDWINRYIDSVRFTSVDEIQVDNSREYNTVAIAPGFHDITVYFYWDLGSTRGLAPALVSYAASRETLSRTLRFNARAGETYTVHAQRVFDEAEEQRDITTIDHVDFWVEDESGYEIVSREDGRYIATQ
ncbi:MAG: hypothetical protein GKR91_03800 [Pseudomonadales bacterium]|nr:hypothetical protein [Pseudomonadales bacterium]